MRSRIPGGTVCYRKGGYDVLFCFVKSPMTNSEPLTSLTSLLWQKDFTVVLTLTFLKSTAQWCREKVFIFTLSKWWCSGTSPWTSLLSCLQSCYIEQDLKRRSETYFETLKCDRWSSYLVGSIPTLLWVRAIVKYSCFQT